MDKPCQFPFIFKNETFNSCTPKHDPDDKLWCSTRTNPITNEHIKGQDLWGYCPNNVTCNCECIDFKTCSWSKQISQVIGMFQSKRSAKL